MKILVSLFLTALVLSNVGPVSFAQTSKAAPAGAEVTIGDPIFIPYSRAFALLDGLFQDVSAIQIAQLNTVNPNQPNATRLDAVIERFQASVEYNKLLGIQNAASARQSAAFSSSMRFESQLLNQQSQLVSLLASTQQQAFAAQAIVDNPNSTEEERIAAQARVTAANSTITAINTQINTIKTLRATELDNSSASTFVSPDPAPVPSPILALPSMPNAKSDTDFVPSFSASKQIETQVQTLWLRLAHLIDTMVTSQNTGSVYLMKFNTGISAGRAQKKRPLLTTQYLATCSTGAEKPQVLDMFPRSSAINIVDQKYKDSQFGVSALLSFFGIGGNIAYNREHLKVTQSLGQAAYITGSGIQTNMFGWMFGPTLAEDFPAPGSRTTFALISFPSGCGDGAVSVVNNTWDKEPANILLNQALAPGVARELKKETITAPGAAAQGIAAITYSPVEFDSSPGASAAIVTINLKLNRPLDREQVVSVNGSVLKRARDSFGRATSSAVNVPGGILSAADNDAESWFPVGDQEMILSLTASQFKENFPSIVLSSPSGSIDVNSLVDTVPRIQVSGRTFVCPTTSGCAAYLPSLGQPRVDSKRIEVSRWQQDPDVTLEHLDHFLFKLHEPPASSTPAIARSIPAVQFVRGMDRQAWSSRARVAAIQGTSTFALQCELMGEFLDCATTPQANAGPTQVLPRSAGIEFEIYDPAHAIGPMKGTADLGTCVGSECFQPIILESDGPTWDAVTDNRWIMNLKLANMLQYSYIHLGTFTAPLNLSGDGYSHDARIIIQKARFPDMSDTMPVAGSPDGSTQSRPFMLGSNLRTAISPILLDINDDLTQFSGFNLVFDEIRLNKGGRAIPLSCTAQRTCEVVGGFQPAEKGFLHFYAGPARFLPFLRLTDNGVFAVPALQSKAEQEKEKKKGDDGKPKTKSNPQIRFNFPPLRFIKVP